MLGPTFETSLFSTADFAGELLRRTQILYEKTKKNAVKHNIHDVLRQKSRFREKDFCYTLQPKADNQGSKTPFRDVRWIDSYVKEVLSNENYIVRKVNTNKIQI